MPDNWNILASLLGTPRPPEPAAEKAVEKKNAAPEAVKQPATDDSATPKASPPANDELDQRSDVSRSSLRESHSTTSRPSAEVSQTSDSDDAGKSARSDNDSDTDVLQALTAVQPPPRLPGFGVFIDEPARPSQPAPRAAATSGFGSVEKEIHQRDSKLSAGRGAKSADDRQRSERSGRPPRREGGSGFANGLGAVAADEDFENDDEIVGFVDDDLDVVDDISDDMPAKSPGRDPEARHSGRTGSSEGRPRGDHERGPRGRDRDVAEDDASPSRRRGRRGQRQRMSEADVATNVPRSETPTLDHDDDFGRPTGGGRDTTKRRSGNTGSDDRGPREERSRGDRGPRAERSREPAETQPAGRARRGGPREAHAGDKQSNAGDRDRGGRSSTPDSFGAGVVPPRDDDESPTHARSSRGSQGGRQRGEQRGRPVAETRSQHGRPPVADEEDDDDVGFAADLFDDFEILEVDDLLDDDGDAELGSPRSGSQGEKSSDSEDDGPRAGRRSRRGGRRRGRRGSGAAETTDSETLSPANKKSEDLPRSAFDDDLEDDEEIEAIRDRPRTDNSNEPRERSRRGGRGRGRDRDSRTDNQTPQQEVIVKQDFPSWNELVNSVVDKNLSGRRSGGGGGSGSSRGGGSGSSGGGNRGGSSGATRGRRR